MPEGVGTDIPPNVAQGMMADIAGNITAANTVARNNFTIAGGVLQGSMARRFDEDSVAQGKTAAGILATDVGGPTNKAGT